MIAYSKPATFYEIPSGYFPRMGQYAAVAKDGSLLIYNGSRCISALNLDATESQFKAVARAHAEGYKSGERDARDNIGGAFRTFLLTLGIDLEDMESKIDRLKESR